MGSRYQADVCDLAESSAVPWDAYEGKTVVVTGATGLIGGLLTHVLLRRVQIAADIEVVLPVRNTAKARSLFQEDEHVRIVPWDAVDGRVPEGVDSCDYLIHCASNTDSKRMVSEPVDTIMTTVLGTQSMLELVRRTGARMCFVSSMEVYGQGDSVLLDESRGGELDAMNVRSSYPQAKQLAETLCASYVRQFGVEACVARLAQSFGPGVASSDKRVFAEFARCCSSGKDIVLLTDGSKSNMYVYTADAVAALLLLAVRGAPGEAYNVANEQTYCSIWEMANMVRDTFGPRSKVLRATSREAAERYAVSGSLRLDTSRIRALGWEPTVGLQEMYLRMMDDWK